MKLIFFVAADPAAEALLLADPAFLATVPRAHDLRSRVDNGPRSRSGVRPSAREFDGAGG